MKKTIGCILIAAAIFATAEIALKWTNGAFDALQITFLRFIIGGLILLPFAYCERKKKRIENVRNKIDLKNFAYIIMLGILCIPIDMVFFQLAVFKANAGTVAVIFCSNPIATTIFSHFIIKGDRLSRQKILAILVGAAGLIFMITPWHMEKGNTLSGVLFAVLAAIFFGLYSALGGKTIHKIGIFTQTSISFISGSIVLLFVLLILGKPVLQNIFYSPRITLLVLYVGIFVTGLAYLFYFLAIKYGKPSLAGNTFFIKIVLAPILAFLILKEPLTIYKMIGIVFVLFGSLLITFEHMVRYKKIRN